jgi:hypothetical protein
VRLSQKIVSANSENPARAANSWKGIVWLDTGVCGIKKKKKKKKKRKAEKGKREKGAREEKTHHSFWILMTAVPFQFVHTIN